MLTDNRVLVDNARPLPALMCVQRKAPKIVPTEDDFIRSNLDSFGNEIGQTTNWITSMYEVQAGFARGTREYETLEYRIQCGQMYQQNVIDKAKGIVAKHMPKYWHDYYAVSKIDDKEDRDFQRSIAADKKPYFMRYIYPALQRQYNTYIKNTNRNALREFGMTVCELQALPYSELSERQKEFLRYYDHRMPVGLNDCVMNKICRRFEQEFDGYIGKQHLQAEGRFDFSIMKSEGGDAEYTPRQLSDIRRLYNSYSARLRSYAVFAAYERISEAEAYDTLSMMDEEWRRECDRICPNTKALCNIILEICYKKNSSKKFAWSMCGDEIIRNLLRKNDNLIHFPTLDAQGDLLYGGHRFLTKSIKLEEDVDK